MFKVRLRSSIVLMAVTIFLMVTGGDILFAGMASTAYDMALLASTAITNKKLAAI